MRVNLLPRGAAPRGLRYAARVFFVVVEVLGAVLLALPIHEAGHWCAARALGARDVALERSGWFAACVRASFPDGARAPRALFFAAGPAASTAAGAFAFALGAPLAGGIQLCFSLLMLMPTRGSDGARLLSLVVERR